MILLSEAKISQASFDVLTWCKPEVKDYSCNTGCEVQRVKFTIVSFSISKLPYKGLDKTVGGTAISTPALRVDVDS